MRFRDEFCRTRPATCSFRPRFFVPWTRTEPDVHLIKQVEQVARFALEARPGSFPRYRT
jgi:hypothetical protein